LWERRDMASATRILLARRSEYAMCRLVTRFFRCSSAFGASSTSEKRAHIQYSLETCHTAETKLTRCVHISYFAYCSASCFRRI